MEFAKGFIVLEADFRKAERELNKVEREFKSSHENMQSDVDDTVKKLEELNQTLVKTGKQTKKAGGQMASAFATATSAVSGFGAVFGAIFKMVQLALRGFMGVFRAFNNLLFTGFSGIIKMTEQIMRTFLQMGSAGGIALDVIATALAEVIKVAETFLKTLAQIPIMFWQIAVSAGRALGSVRDWFDELTKKLVFVQLDIRYIISQMRNFALAFTGAIGGATAALANFEEAFVKVRRVMDLTDDQFQVLEHDLRGMASETTATASELAELAFVAGQLGIEGGENIREFTRLMDQLTQTTRITGEEGAAQFARLMHISGESVDTMENMASAVVDLGRNFAVFEDELLTMAMRVAGPASVIGIATEEILALSGAMAAAGVRAEKGGSAMSRIIMEVAEASHQGGDELEAFAEISGMTEQQFASLVKESPIDAIQEFVDGLGDIVDEGGNVFRALDRVNLSQIRTRDVVLRLVEAGGLLNDTLQVSTQAYAEGTAMATEFEERMGTLWAQIQQLRSEFLELARTLAAPFLERSRQAVEITREFVQRLQDLDSEQMETIVGFAAMAATIFTVLTALLMATKGIFTFLTGVTLLVRAVLFLLPIILALRVLSNIFAEIEDLDPVSLFYGLVRALSWLYTTLTTLIPELLTAFGETELYENWADIVSNSIDRVREAFQEFGDSEEYGVLDLALDVSLITADALGDMISEMSSAMSRFRTWAREEDIAVFEDMSTALIEFEADADERGWLHLALAIANIFYEAFLFTFKEIPLTLHTILQETQFYQMIKEVGHTWGEAILLGISEAFDYMTDIIAGEDGMVVTIQDFSEDLPEGWMDDWWADVRAFEPDVPEVWQGFYTSTVNMLGAIYDLFVATFSGIGDAIAKATDWDQVIDEIEAKLTEGFLWTADKLEKLAEDVIPGMLGEGVEDLDDNELWDAILKTLRALTHAYVALFIEVMRAAWEAAPWFKLGWDLAGSLLSGMWARLQGDEAKAAEVGHPELSLDVDDMAMEDFSLGFWDIFWGASRIFSPALDPVRERREEARTGKEILFGTDERPGLLWGQVEEDMSIWEEFISLIKDVPWALAEFGITYDLDEFLETMEMEKAEEAVKTFETRVDSLDSAQKENLRTIFDVIYAEEELTESIRKADFNLERFMMTLAKSESSLRAGELSETGALGLFQFVPWTQEHLERELDKTIDWEDPIDNTQAALHWLSTALEDEGHTLEKVMRELGISLEQALHLWWIGGAPGMSEMLAEDDPFEYVLTLGATVNDILDKVERIEREFGVNEFSKGAILPGYGGGDQIPAMLERGEAVVPASIVAQGLDAIVNWFSANGVGFRQGTTGSGGGGSPLGVRINEILSPHVIEDIEENTGTNLTMLDTAMDQMDSLLTNMTNYMGDMGEGVIKAIEWLGEILIWALEPVLEPEQVEWLRNMVGKMTEGIEDLLTIGEGFFDKIDAIEDTVSEAEEETPDVDVPKTPPAFPAINEAIESLSFWFGFLRDNVESVSEVYTDFVWDTIHSFRSLNDFLDHGARVGKGFVNSISRVSLNISQFSFTLLEEASEISNVMSTFREVLADTAGEGFEASNSLATLVTHGDPLIAVFAVIAGMLSETRAFQDFLEMVTATFQMLFEALNPLVEAIIPILEVQLNTLAKLLELVAGVLQILAPIIENVVLPIVELLATAILAVIKGIAALWNALLDLISMIPFVDLTRFKIELKGAQKATEDFTKTLQEAVRNIPAGFRVGRAVWAAGVPGEPMGFASNPYDVKVIDFSPTAAREQMTQSQPSQVNIYFQDRVYGVNDLREIIKDAAEEGKEENDYRDSGSRRNPGSRYQK